MTPIDSIIQKQLRGSTLVEVLVALVIFTLVTAIAASIFIKITKKQPAHTRDLQWEMKEMARLAKEEGDYTPNLLLTRQGVTVYKHISHYKGDTLLWLLEYRGQVPGASEETIYRELIINSE